MRDVKLIEGKLTIVATCPNGGTLDASPTNISATLDHIDGVAVNLRFTSARLCSCSEGKHLIVGNISTSTT